MLTGCIRWLILVLFMVAIVAVMLVAGEYATRYVYRDITTTGDNSSWFARRWHLADLGQDRSGLNKAGFRDGDWALPKPDGVYRIALVGDSFTYGQGIDREARMSNIISKVLNDEGLNVEVMNVGKPGASVRHHALHLRLIAEYEPDFVLLQFTPNDFEDVGDGGSMPRPQASYLMPIRNWHKWLHQHSALYYVLNSGFQRLTYSMSVGDPYPVWLAKRFSDPQSADGIKARERMLRQLRMARRVANRNYGLVAFPMFDENFDAKNYAYKAMHDIVDEGCARLRADCIDLTPVFGTHTGPGADLVLSHFDTHPSELANEIATAAILKHFGPLWRKAAAEKQP